jgi:hypothetical protein
VVGTESTWHRSLKMLVIVSVSHFDGNVVAIHVASPKKEISAVLSDFGLTDGAIISQLRLLSKTGRQRAVEIPSVGRSASQIAFTRIPLVSV